MFLLVNKSKRLGFLLNFGVFSLVELDFYVGRLEGQNPATRKENMFKRAGYEMEIDVAGEKLLLLYLMLLLLLMLLLYLMMLLMLLMLPPLLMLWL